MTVYSNQIARLAVGGSPASPRGPLAGAGCDADRQPFPNPRSLPRVGTLAGEVVQLCAGASLGLSLNRSAKGFFFQPRQNGQRYSVQAYRGGPRIVIVHRSASSCSSSLIEQKHGANGCSSLKSGKIDRRTA